MNEPYEIDRSTQALSNSDHCALRYNASRVSFSHLRLKVGDRKPRIRLGVKPWFTLNFARFVFCDVVKVKPSTKLYQGQQWICFPSFSWLSLLIAEVQALKYPDLSAMAPPRRSRRARQTQLTFSPLPTSSPGVSDYSEQVQRRAAAVRFEDSPSPEKRRKLSVASPSEVNVRPSKGRLAKQSQLSSGSRLSSGPVTRSGQSRHRSKDAALPTPAASSQAEQAGEPGKPMYSGISCIPGF